MESFKSDLRSVLLANKRGVHIGQLPGLYQQLTGTRIYYNRNRFNSLESFLESMPDTCQLNRFNDQTIVTGVASANQSQLQSLIRSQKTDKSDMGKPSPRVPFSQSSYNSSGGGRFSGRPQWNGSPPNYSQQNCSPQNGKRNYWRGNNPNNYRRNNDRWQAENEAKSSRPAFGEPEEEQSDRPRWARVSKGESRAGSREASRSASRTENETEQENGTSNGSDHGIRSRRESGGSPGLRGDSRSSERENRNLENSTLIEKFDSINSSERRVNQQRSPKTSSTESLNKKAKFSDEFFKLRLEVKTMDGNSIDYKFNLANFLKQCKLDAPKYSATENPSGELVGWFGKVQIGNRNFVTFPDCYDSEASAEQAVAKKAFTSLLDLMSSTESLSENEEDQIDGIVRLFERDDTFLSEYVEKRYHEVYHQDLSPNWLDLIKSSNRFSVTETRAGPKSYHLVSLAKPAGKSTDTFTQQSAKIGQVKLNGLSKVEDQKEDRNFSDDELEAESAEIEDPNEAVLVNGGGDFRAESDESDDEFEIKNGLESPPEEETRCTNLDEVAVTYKTSVKIPNGDFLCPKDLPLHNGMHDAFACVPCDPHTLHTILELPSDLELDMEHDWTVHVLDTNEAGQVMLRLADGYEELNKLTSEMSRFYLQLRKGKLKKLLEGNCYVVVLGKTVFRVQLLQLLPKDQVRCRFLDDGVVEVVSRFNLFEIDRQFLRLPWQSFPAKLAGVDADLIGKYAPLIRLFIELKMLEHESTLQLVAKPICLEPVTVHLFDTSNPDRDLDLNKLLIDFLSRK